jgi:hypothetical protein
MIWYLNLDYPSPHAAFYSQAEQYYNLPISSRIASIGFAKYYLIKITIAYARISIF